MSMNKRAAEVIRELVEENKSLRELISKNEREEKVASIQRAHGLDNEAVQKLASMNDDEFKNIDSILNSFPVDVAFGEAEETNKVASQNALEESKARVLSFLNN